MVIPTRYFIIFYSGFRVQGQGFRVKGSGSRVQDWGLIVALFD